jgi:hypothetical protein
MPSPAGGLIERNVYSNEFSILHEKSVNFNATGGSEPAYLLLFPPGFSFLDSEAAGWSPIRLFAGQTAKIGHFLQPTAMATGQRVIVFSW